MKSNKGFTLIELVTVIVILGIISATALPRFINLTDDAHKAVVDGLYGSFRSAVSMYHNCWIVRGQAGHQVDLSCFGDGDVDSTVTGYPLGVDTATHGNSGTTLTGGYCLELWGALLQGDDFQLAFHANASFNSSNDIIYWYSGGPIANANTYCYYNYIADNPNKGNENWQIRYYPGTGEVTLGRATLG